MTTIYIPDETAAKLLQAAHADGRSLDDLVGEGLAAYLASRSQLAQCVATRLPSRSPAAASTKAPVQTEP